MHSEMLANEVNKFSKIVSMSMAVLPKHGYCLEQAAAADWAKQVIYGGEKRTGEEEEIK